MSIQSNIVFRTVLIEKHYMPSYDLKFRLYESTIISQKLGFCTGNFFDCINIVVENVFEHLGFSKNGSRIKFDNIYKLSQIGCANHLYCFKDKGHYIGCYSYFLNIVLDEVKQHKNLFC